MAVLIDPPAWPAHGRLWSHLASDASFAELHAFALAAGVPRRAFEGDHYDVPEERYAGLVASGAVPVAGRELLRALQRSGLRLPKRRGELVLGSWPHGRLLPHSGPHRVDLVRSLLGPPSPPAATLGLALRGGNVALVEDDLPVVRPDAGRALAHVRARSERDGRRWYLALRRVSADDLGGPEVRWTTPEQMRRSRVSQYWWPAIDRELETGGTIVPGGRDESFPMRR